nr:hypothetical protein [Fodinibius halophilus]
MNVSSPGLSRPLVDRRQYPKNKGRQAKVKYKENGEYRKVEGVLREILKDEIIIELEDESTLAVPFDDLVETKIIPSFK